MRLAEQIGSFAGQITKSSLSQVTVEYQGDAAALNVKPLTAILLQGLLAPQMESVNMVNAPLIAKERDIQVSEVRTESCADYHSVVRLTVTTERQTRTVAGTLFGGDKPRIIDINGIPVEAELGRHVLYVVNEDKPGFIGALGTVLGTGGVNIASFHLGRDARGGRAIALVSVDQPVADGLLDQVQALPNVVQALALEFS
jgi:D-3-phosphoglycerate dehydrogenase